MSSVVKRSVTCTLKYYVKVTVFTITVTVIVTNTSSPSVVQQHGATSWVLTVPFHATKIEKKDKKHELAGKHTLLHTN